MPFERDMVSVEKCVGCNCGVLSGCSSTRARLRGESLYAEGGLSGLIDEDFGARFGSFRPLGKQLGPGVGSS